MAKTREPKPLIEITPENLIKLRHQYYLGNSTAVCMVLCHFIDSVAANKGWDLNNQKWTHNDGRQMRGHLMEKTELEVYREPCERDLEVLYIVKDLRTDCTLVVLQDENDSMDNYHCHRYFKIGEVWQHSYDAQKVGIEVVWEWLKSPGAMPTDGIE